MVVEGDIEGFVFLFSKIVDDFIQLLEFFKFGKIEELKMLYVNLLFFDFVKE